MNRVSRRLLDAIVSWWCCNVFFVSVGKHWKGIYWHIFPKYCVRTYWVGIDWHKKPKYFGS